MNNEICDINKCTGCFACYSICRTKAINMVQNEEGFYYPQILLDKCIGCSMCKNVCPVNNNIENVEEKEVYACWLKNDKMHAKSTSGGAFSAISRYIFEHDGIICAARYDEQFRVVHEIAKLEEELKYFRGSKYVQSFVGDAYLSVKEYLKKGIFVAFVGTPCQVHGLCSYLGKKYKNLITIDLVCHGVPSPKIYKDYLQNIENKYKDTIHNINFRYKKPGWNVFSMRIDFESGKIYRKDCYHDPFLVGFLDELFSRPCCSSCNYTNLNRAADITLADFWGYTAPSIQYNDHDKGVSMVMINTIKGKKVFHDNLVRESIIIVPKTISEAMKGNRCLSNPYPRNSRYDEFWKDNLCMTYDMLQKKYLQPRYKKILIYYMIILYGKLPYTIREEIKIFAKKWKRIYKRH